jgi:hypothetical protein
MHLVRVTDILLKTFGILDRISCHGMISLVFYLYLNDITVLPISLLVASRIIIMIEINLKISLTLKTT